MFLVYVDSSSRPDFLDPENFVLASIITNETSWQTIDNGVKQIKLNHFPGLPDSKVEIHAKDMLNRDGIFKQMRWEKVYAVFDDVFSFIADPKTELSIIAVVIDKSKLRKNKDIEIWAHRLLFERINIFTKKQNDSLIQAGYAPQYTIMFTDTQGPTKDRKLREKLLGMLRGGTFYSKLDYLIEDLIFTDSRWRNLSQLADCIAYCIKKKFRTNTPSIHTTNWLSYFKKIEAKFDNPDGSYLGYGLKIFP